MTITPTHRRRMTLLTGHVCALYVVWALLGCAQQTKDRIAQGTQRLKEATNFNFTGLFGEKDVSEKTRQRAKQAAADQQEMKSSPPSTGETARTASFDIPNAWSVANFIEDSFVYQLKHAQHDSASLVVSYHELPSAESERKSQLRDRHQGLLAKFPKTFEQLEYREWMVDGRPHIHTRLKGRKAPETPELIIDGYSVAIDQDSYLVFSAIETPDHGALGADVAQLVSTLRPLPSIPDEPAPAPAEPEATPADAPTTPAPASP